MGLSNIGSNARPGICTSTTRPTTPYEGQLIYETDTDLLQIWNGSAWRPLAFSTATQGSVLQVQSTTVTGQPYVASGGLTTFVDISGMSVTITPRSASSRIMVQVFANIGPNTSDDTSFQLVRNGTNIATGTGATYNHTLYFRGDNQSGAYLTLWLFPVHINFLDSPSTTSAVTYQLRGGSRINGFYLNRRASDTAFSTVSTMTAWEVAG